MEIRLKKTTKLLSDLWQSECLMMTLTMRIMTVGCRYEYTRSNDRMWRKNTVSIFILKLGPEKISPFEWGLRVLAIAWAWVSTYIYVPACVCVSRPSAFGGSLRQVCQAWVRTSLHLHLSWSQFFYILNSRLNLGNNWMPTLFVVQWLNLNSLPLKRLLTQSLWRDCVERLMGKL